MIESCKKSIQIWVPLSWIWISYYLTYCAFTWMPCLHHMGRWQTLVVHELFPSNFWNMPYLKFYPKTLAYCIWHYLMEAAKLLWFGYSIVRGGHIWVHASKIGMGLERQRCGYLFSGTWIEAVTTRHSAAPKQFQVSAFLKKMHLLSYSLVFPSKYFKKSENCLNHVIN